MTIAQHERIRMTAEQYLQLGEDPPGVRLELVNGEIVVSASPSTAHAYTLLHLGSILLQYVETHKLGTVLSDTDHVMTIFDVRRPDLFYFRYDRIHLIGDGPIRHPPDLAVEVISPGSMRTDRIDKFAAYGEFGINNYWIVDPIGRTIKAYRLRSRKYAIVGNGSREEEVSFPPFKDLVLHLSGLWWPPK